MCIRDSIQGLYDEAGKLLDSLENLSQEQADEILTLRYRFLYCLLYTSDAADERSSVDLGGRRIIKKKKI